MSEFSKNLIRLRTEIKISQQKLAENVGVTQQCVSGWEKDIIEPTLTNLWRMADFFDVSVDYLIGRKDY